MAEPRLYCLGPSPGTGPHVHGAGGAPRQAQVLPRARPPNLAAGQHLGSTWACRGAPWTRARRVIRDRLSVARLIPRVHAKPHAALKQRAHSRTCGLAHGLATEEYCDNFTRALTARNGGHGRVRIIRRDALYRNTS